MKLRIVAGNGVGPAVWVQLDANERATVKAEPLPNGDSRPMELHPEANFDSTAVYVMAVPTETELAEQTAEAAKARQATGRRGRTARR